MKCDKCLKKDYCVYIHQFNHDPSIACIEFINTENLTYISTITLDPKENVYINNKELKGLERLENKNLPCANCEELQALKIIKEKGNFISFEYDEYDDKYYIYDNELYMHNEITKEEYDLLKKVFEYN